MTPQKVGEFMEWVDTWSAGAHPPLFCYLATERDGQWALIKGVLYLNLVSRTPPSLPEFSVGDIRAGYFSLDSEPGALLDFCGDLVTGRFLINQTPVSMTGRSDGTIDRIEVDAPMAETGNVQTRVTISKLMGALHGRALGPQLSWLLRSADTPFDALDDLSGAYFLGHIDDVATIEVNALHAAFVHDSSTVTGQTANLVVKVLSGFDPALLRVGYRILSAAPGTPPRRGTFETKEFTWSKDESDYKGVLSFDVDHGSVVQAFATYAGKTQQRWTFIDPQGTLNPRRIAYETYDAKLEKLLSWVAPDTRKSGEFEFAIRTLGWMLGFDGLHLDRNRGLGDGPDILLTSPEGVIMMECTIGPFGNDKIAKLVGRQNLLRRRFNDKERPDVAVYAVLASTRFESESSVEIKETSQHGVAFLGQESLQQLVQRTYSPPNTTQLFEQLAELSGRSERTHPPRFRPSDSRGF